MYALAAAVGMITTLATMVMAYLGWSVALSYNPDSVVASAALPASTVILGIAVLALFVSRSVDPPLKGLFTFAALGIGALLLIVSVLLSVSDSGDFVLYSLPGVTGVCLLMIWFEALSEERAR
ncbi:hypothetical protein BOO69_16230 [Sulfitobacter alexandrii]|uniref:Uncharacterized protein n=1 Tax=Sulfitobacter alexandrii TaxID=1917485 RepID=A0A1J0WKH9_9RHOB|nr:hypothetical protein [Sulfitobacter alexandrii]APE44773.1 hypothetical protein BOO69_16230 [Sulfitobacter alexandrii]